MAKKPVSQECTLHLKGLACAHCAAKREQAVAALAGVEQASVSFATQRLRMAVAPGADALAVEQAARQVVRGIEPDVVVSREGAQTAPGHAHGEEKNETFNYIRLGLAIALFAIALVLSGTPKTIFFLLAYALAGYDVLLKAARNIAKGQIFDENFLMAVASLSAFLLGDHAEGVAVLLFYQVGEAFQDRAVGRSRKSIAALLNIRPETATLMDGDTAREVAPESVSIGAVVQVKPGERVPLDGVVTQGHASLDTSALTGESLPREVAVGDEVLSGSVSNDGLLLIRVTKSFGESTASKILDMVQNASERKTRTERFITRFARVYTPVVVGAAVLLAVIPPLILPGASWSDWVHRGLTFLVVSCPCALVISVPLGYFGGIGAASRKGVLCKGSDALDALCAVQAMVMDKTGTLTQGKFSVIGAYPADGVTEPELLRAAACAEQVSNHPIAQSVLRAAKTEDIPKPDIAQEIAGRGVRVVIGDETLLAGNLSLMREQQVTGVTEQTSDVGSVVYVARQGQYIGALTVADTLKPDAKQAIAQVHALGVTRTVMLTGDREEVARHVAAAVGIDEVHAGLLPAQKMEQLERIMGEMPGKVAFVGDGINDAPVLARADVGIAMGGLGADAAIEAADIVLMDDQPGKIPLAVRIARRTRGIVMQNIVFALGVKAVVLLLSAVGFANMWAAVFADVGVAILAILNAMRATRVQG